MKIKRQPSIAKLKKRAWGVFSRYVRLRDSWRTTGSLEYGECVSCNRTLPFSELDAGHFVPKKSGNYFSERGVNAQCRSCNRFHSGNPLEYRRELIRRYGEGVDLELEAEARQSVKFTQQGLLELIEHYKAAIKKLEEDK